MTTGDGGAGSRLPGGEMRADRMPGHWLLARLGKRVLRPGGLAMTQALLADLAIGANDDVVELAPGLGLTAALVLARRPRSYVGIERDRDAAAWTARRLPDAPQVAVRAGAAESTGLGDGCASVVLGEAMLSMNPPEHKQRIMAEANRVLRPGGRYAIHELAIVPDEVAAEVKTDTDARRRVLTMRRCFLRHRAHLAAISVVARK